jgi:hypothetical protein
MRCACVALLRGRCRVRAGARCAGLPVRGIGYCETAVGYPPPFFRCCVWERRILSTCVVVVLLSCCVPVACGAVHISVALVYPCGRALYAGRVLYGYCAMLYPLAGAMCPLCPYIYHCAHFARYGYIVRYAPYIPPICVYIAQAPALDRVQRKRLCYVMRLFGRSCVRLCVLLCVRAMCADILPRRCQ